MQLKAIVLDLLLLTVFSVQAFHLPGYNTYRLSKKSLSRLDAVGDPVFCVNVNLYVKPERRDEFLEVIAANCEGTLTSEPLAIQVSLKLHGYSPLQCSTSFLSIPSTEQYSWGESILDVNTFHFHEQYHGKGGFEAHQKTSHFADWERFAGEKWASDHYHLDYNDYFFAHH